MPEFHLRNDDMKFNPIIAAILIFIAMNGVASKAHAQEDEVPTSYVFEMTLNSSERLDAIRYLQSRIVQPEEGGRYFVRAARVLLPEDSNAGVFTYLVTFQTYVPENRAYDPADLYTVAGYYIVIIERVGDDFEIVDEISVTPIALLQRLQVASPPPPELTNDIALFDYTDAVFDATHSELVTWRDQLVENIWPRWEWIDLTGDGGLDCVLDIEGFEYQPTSYYTVLVPTVDGFIEGFSSWDYDTVYTEIEYANGMAVKADHYVNSESGDFLPYWRDFYIWNGYRFIIANLNFTDQYNGLIQPLHDLVDAGLAAETSDSGRWAGKSRFEINVERYREGLGIPYVFYFNLARIAEYQGNFDAADGWWSVLLDYINEEYNSQELVNVENLSAETAEAIPDYGEWRDEYYSAAEVALSGE